jgi:hypothetical protein
MPTQLYAEDMGKNMQIIILAWISREIILNAYYLREIFR